MESPLRMLVQRLVHGAPATLDALAAELDTSVALVEMMLDDLQKGGYIQPVETTACNRHCTDCPSRAGCGLQHHGRIWSVTAKGFRFAADTDSA